MMSDRFLPSACEEWMSWAPSRCMPCSHQEITIIPGLEQQLRQRSRHVPQHALQQLPEKLHACEIEISNLDILRASLGPDNCFGAVGSRPHPAR